MDEFEFPEIDVMHVGALLCRINAEAEGPCDVRLQVTADGWDLHFGDPGYDTDHRGAWGSGSVPGANRRFPARDVAADLIEQAREQHAQTFGD